MNFPDAAALCVELKRRGVQLQKRGDKLVCLPKGAAGELLPEVARFKPALLELLTQREAQVKEAARARLALSSSPTWKQIRPLFAVAHAAQGFDPAFKPEHLLFWAQAQGVAREDDGEEAPTP